VRKKFFLAKHAPLLEGQKISLNSNNAKPILVTNNETKQTLEFPSAVSAGKF
jgi:hypothetical protein